MTQKRKAELQRKLSMAPVAKPPSGLADRLKADIPEYLDARRDRQRMAHSVAFTMRVAASIILLVTSVFLTIQLISRDDRQTFDLTGSESAPPSPVATPDTTVAATSEAAPPPPPVAQEESAAAASAVETQRRQDAPRQVAEVRPVTSAAAQNRTAPQGRISDTPAIGGVTGGVTGGVMADATEARPREAVATADTALAESRPVETRSRIAADMSEEAAAPAAPAAPPPPPAVPPAALTRAESSRVAAPAMATQFAKSHDGSVFGISTDPTAFRRLRDTIARGEKPAAPAVDVAALVNHFAGRPAVAPREVELQVEASQIPLSTDGRAVIRYTIDSAVPATAKLTIEVRRGAVESYRVFGGDVGAVEEVLSAGQSVTGLIEIRAKQPASAATTVASVILEYRTPGGRPRTLTRPVRIMDLTKSWPEASRRHRLATLAAIWGESLLAAKADADIAETATELAEEEPEDERARELAAAATASSRRQSSAPTGSGR